jgi:hypothetical protein
VRPRGEDGKGLNWAARASTAVALASPVMPSRLRSEAISVSIWIEEAPDGLLAWGLSRSIQTENDQRADTKNLRRRKLPRSARS